MKNDPLTMILLVVLGVFALAAVGLCMFYIHDTRLARSYQANIMMINGRDQAIRQLATDALEYSKRNPAIDPILEAAGVKPKSGAATNNTKAGTK